MVDTDAERCGFRLACGAGVGAAIAVGAADRKQSGPEVEWFPRACPIAVLFAHIGEHPCYPTCVVFCLHGVDVCLDEEGPSLFADRIQRIEAAARVALGPERVARAWVGGETVLLKDDRAAVVGVA